jgi:hypothetical protein
MGIEGYNSFLKSGLTLTISASVLAKSIFTAPSNPSNPKKSKIHPSNPTNLHQINQKRASKS